MTNTLAAGDARDDASAGDAPDGASDDTTVPDEDDLEGMLGATSAIGRAVELLKHRDGLDDEAAFNCLVNVAEACNMRLRDAAADLLADGDATSEVRHLME